ncbi:MAG TPA: CAP domain-containing protein [Candidatus Aquilonibacter sp.]|nr:CAP domain-containing protein [Candidatus Aquilonibacter sp.]
MGRIRGISVVMGALMVATSAKPASPPPPKVISVAEQYLFNAANAERAERGIPPLKWDETLHRAAERHAGEMAARESISHQYPGEAELAVRGRDAGARFTVISENVAEAWSAPEIHDAWMHSPDHRANLLDPRVNSIGISVERRDGQLYAVEDFDRSIASLRFEDQEAAIADLLQTEARVSLLPDAEDARRTCEMDTGYAGARKPWFVMRFTTASLDRLPSMLRARLATGKYHAAAVGACNAKSTGPFTAYAVAVMLFP